MKFMYQNSFFTLLVAVAIASLEASSGHLKPHYKEPETSLEKCVKHLEALQANFGLDSLPLSKISTFEDCSDTIENIFSNIPSEYHPSQMLFAPRSGLEYVHSKVFSSPARDENSSKRNIGKNLFSKYVFKRTMKNIPGKDASAGNAQSKMFANSDDLNTNDIINRQENLRSVEFNEKSLSSALKSGESLLNRLTSLSIQPKTFNSFDTLKETPKGDTVLDNEGSLTNKTPIFKRGSDNWFNVINTDVAKRRRQTLSINNALMALTDMVMEHGREKLMRNRDNLRYHMLVQG